MVDEMTIYWERDAGILLLGGKQFLCECIIRERKLHNPIEVVYTMPAPGKPYMPEKFPKGKWQVYRPEPRDDDYKAPWYIPTNASQPVHVWELDSMGGYANVTPKTVIDRGYGLHASTSRTTLGCGRVGKPGTRTEIEKLVRIIDVALAKGESVWLEVV